MRRKRAAIVLGMSCILMASAVLQGCQQNPKSGKVEIELVQYKPEAVDIFEQLEKEFNETHDDIHLKISSPNDATTILKTRFIREDYPDIIGIGGDINYSYFVDSGILADLSDYEGLSEVKPAYLDIIEGLEFVPTEGTYGLPYVANAAGVLYNKDMFAIVATIVVNVLSLVLALGLNSKIKFKSALRGMYFVPNILGALVVGYIFNYFFTYILPAVVKMMGGKGDSILASSKWAWVAIVIVCAWQSVAMNTIIYISGLQTVPEDVYEAGSLDGATGWKKFKNLTFPLILPFFTINMVLCMKNFLMVFDQIMALTKGGPAQSTESISFLIYNNGMAGGQFGFQSANAVVFFVVIVVISVLQMNFLGNKEEQL